LLLDNKEIAAPYRKDMDVEKIAIVYIINEKITDIKIVATEQELREILEDDSPMSYIAPVINKVMK